MKNIQNKILASSKISDIIIALVIGISTGIGAVLFRYLINGVQWVGYTWFPKTFAGLGNFYVVIVPAIGGLIVGPLVYFFAREAKGHGVPEVMEAVALRGGKIRPVVAIVKSLASSVSIGSGGSVGREGPIVQIGSAIGSTIGQKLNLSEDRVRILVACGAAGGIAATFNAPIAGVIFALEVILGEFSVRHFSNVVISSVAASVIGHAVFGNIPAFFIPVEYGIKSLWEFAFYPLLALLAALWGVLFVRVLYWTEDLFGKWKTVPEWIQPMFGGILLGIIALAYPKLTGVTWEGIPQIYNVGYDVIESALASKLALGAAFTLLILKLIATSLTLGSGGSGGVFAPSLFMGAMLGTVFDLGLRLIFPNIPAPPGAYALVGMAAAFSATAHAPITAVLILFELTGDYKIILPLMLTVVITTVLSQHLLKGESIYTLKLTRRGVRLKRGKDIDVLESVLVSEVMSHEFNVIAPTDSLAGFSKLLNQTHSHGAVILNENGKIFGVITITDLERAISNNINLEETTVSQAATLREDMLTVFPDESIGDALYRMGPRGLGRLPVVSREDPNHLLGLVRRYTIIRAYHLALTRRSEITHRARQLEIDQESELDIIHLLVSDKSPVCGQDVKSIAKQLPGSSLLVSLKRDGRMIIPHGETVITAGDSVAIIVNKENIEQLYQLFHKVD
ncbi:MAG: chloride channel protein [Anaerolineales bacterium]|nr:chloride channel protein [Anaerolineales bacterium]